MRTKRLLHRCAGYDSRSLFSSESLANEGLKVVPGERRELLGDFGSGQNGQACLNLGLTDLALPLGRLEGIGALCCGMVIRQLDDRMEQEAREGSLRSL